jgi:carboxymethylenebutenolidase
MKTRHVAAVLMLLTVSVVSLFAQQGPPPGGRQGGGRGGGGGGLGNKAPNLVASVWTASSTVARTMLRHEWVDVPLGNGRLRTWVEYPAGDGPAPVVLVLQHEPGLDDWMRSVADQLALEGFIAVAPDLFSGFGPNGGGFDSFPAPDAAMRVAGPRLTPDEALRRTLAAAEYGLKLPRSNGRIGSLGVGSGGALSFRFAAEAPTVHAAAVFYGAAPAENVLRRVKAPVIGFYGEDDETVTGTVAATVATMMKLGKPFDVHRYPGATHAFLAIQVEGMNGPATADAWPRATGFLKQHLLNAGGRQ